MSRFCVCTLVVCILAPSLAAASSPTHLDGSWKIYINKQTGYCVSYPARWLRGEAFEGAGLWVASGAKKYSAPQGEMDVSAVTEPTALAADYLQLHLEGLRKFERAEKVEMLETRDIQLPGAAGLLAKARYFDPQDHATWIDEVVLAKHEDKLYRLELECRADQVNRFEPMFTHFVESFRLDCNGR